MIAGLPGGFPSPDDEEDDEPIVDGVEHDNDMSLALVPNIGAALAASLAADPDPEVRAAVAQNDSCDAATNDLLAADPVAEVRAALVRSGRVSPDPFVDDPSVSVQSEVARLTKDPATLSTLLAHTSPGVRAGGAVNPVATVTQLRALSEDSDAHVAATATEAAVARGIRVPATSAADPAPTLDRDATEQLLAAESATMRAAGVERGDITASELEAAVSDPEAVVRAAAVARAAAPVPSEAAVTAAASDPEPVVRAAAVARAVAPVLPADVVDVLVGDDSAKVRAAAAGRDDLSAEAQLTLAADPHPAVSNPVILNGSNPARLDVVDVARLTALGVDEAWSRLEELAGDAFVDAYAASGSWNGTLGELAEVYSLTA